MRQPRAENPGKPDWQRQGNNHNNETRDSKDLEQPLHPGPDGRHAWSMRSEEHTSELQSRSDLVCRLLLEKKKNINKTVYFQTFIAYRFNTIYIDFNYTALCISAIQSHHP